MLLPFYSKKIFSKSLSLVKNKSLKFKVFKFIYNNLWFLFKKIHFNFDVIEIKGKNNDNEFHTIIFPPLIEINKLTMIKFNSDKVFVRKTGFNKTNVQISLEHNIYKKAFKHIPKVIKYSDYDYNTTLDIEYFQGDYPDKLNNSIYSFFDNLIKDDKFQIKYHPFYLKMIKKLKNYTKEDSFYKLLESLKVDIENNHQSISLSLMHGDFSLTNILENDVDFLIFDWEHAEEDGMPIDINYYHLRLLIDKKQNIELKKIEDKLAMMYYLYFIYKNGLTINLEYLNTHIKVVK